MRPTIPRHLYLKLIAKASATVRERLEAAHPKQAGDVPSAVREATRLARSAARGDHQGDRDRPRAGQIALRDGRLDEFQVASFAEAGKFDEANAALAALASVPVSIAENMMLETRAEGVMILAKVAAMSWSTVKAIINMRDDLSAWSRPILRPARLPMNGCGLRPHSRCFASTACSRPLHRRLRHRNSAVSKPQHPRPANAPMAATSAVAIVYQVATNSGESSVQCEA